MVTQDDILELIGNNEGIIQSTLPEVLKGERGNINHAIMQLNKKKMIRREVYGVSWKLYLKKKKD
jgi:hypothetical protein